MMAPAIMTTTNIPTLESVLDNQTTDYFREFQAFLHQTFCNENLAFWIAIQQYQLEYPEHGDEKTCHTIVHTHIRSNSIQEINIPCEMRQDILYQVYENRNYHPEVFTHAMDSVLELMRSNSFIPFLQLKQQQQQEEQRNVLQQEEQRKKSTSRLFNTAIINNSSNNILTSSVSCPSIASHHSSSSYSSSTPSVFHRIKRTLLFGNIVVTKRRPSSMPSTPRTSGESSRRSWSPWRKRI